MFDEFFQSRKETRRVIVFTVPLRTVRDKERIYEHTSHFSYERVRKLLAKCEHQGGGLYAYPDKEQGK